MCPHKKERLFFARLSRIRGLRFPKMNLGLLGVDLLTPKL